MRLSAPTQPVFLISVVLFALALIGHFAHVPTLSLYTFWLALRGLCGARRSRNLTKGLLSGGQIFEGA